MCDVIILWRRGVRLCALLASLPAANIFRGCIIYEDRGVMTCVREGDQEAARKKKRKNERKFHHEKSKLKVKMYNKKDEKKDRRLKYNVNIKEEFRTRKIQQRVKCTLINKE